MVYLPPHLLQAKRNDPNQLLASVLQKGAMGSGPKQHWMQGVAQLAHALGAKYKQGQINDEYNAKGEAYNTDLAAALSGVQKGDFSGFSAPGLAGSPIATQGALQGAQFKQRENAAAAQRQHEKDMYTARTPTFETVDNPYGKGGVGQKNSITGQVTGYQAPKESTMKPFWAYDKKAKTMRRVTDGEVSKSPGRFAKDAPDTQLDPTKDYTLDANGKQILTRRGKEKSEETWRTRLKPQIEGLHEINRKMAIVNRATETGDGTADIAAINAYQRMIDDGVVRSEDVRLQAEAVSLKEQMLLWKSKAVKGEMLPPAIRTKMKQMAAKLTNETVAAEMTVVNGWRDVVNRTPGLEWRNVFPEQLNKFLVRQDEGSSDAPPPPPPGAILD